MLEINPTAIDPTPIPFKITGEEFSYVPQKMGPALVRMFTDGDVSGADTAQANWDWLMSGLTAEQQARIIARLSDPADLFDMKHLQELVQGLAEEMTGRPPTSPSVSSPPPVTGGAPSTAGQPPVESTPAPSPSPAT